jgi:hypothetical protein
MTSDEIAAAISTIELGLVNKARLTHIIGVGQSQDNRDIKLGAEGMTVEQSAILLNALLAALRALPT